ncbi:hypothetical protein LCGC14_1413570 [marine sediment metagenome]|uniref:Uncharacterized protein n=2 Tax=marine sediment metagenome TaxID=412755 RepID=A0A0F9MV70_9ZZZZ
MLAVNISDVKLVRRESAMPKCPECKSTKLIKFGKRFSRKSSTGKRRLVQQYQCKNCGRITIHPLMTKKG